MLVEISSVLLWNNQHFTVLRAIQKPQLTAHCTKNSVYGRGLQHVCIRRLTSSACLGLLLMDLKVPGGVWCTWSCRWPKVLPAASPANASALVLCSLFSLKLQFCQLSSSAILTHCSGAHGQNWVSGFMALRTSDHTATNRTASCDLLCQLTTWRAWDRCFPDILWHRGTKSGESCIYFRFCWECGVTVLPILFSPQLLLICLVLQLTCFSHVFMLFCPNISLQFSTCLSRDAYPLHPWPGVCCQGRQMLVHTDVSGL